jgi:hypothetical protein
MSVPEKIGHVGHAEIDFRTGFLAIFRPPRLIFGNYQETVRFPGELASLRSPARRFVSRILRRNV